jgi:hypothetical protein
MVCLTVILLIVSFLGLGLFRTALAQSEPQANEIEAIIELLKAKGIISAEEAATIKQRKPQSDTVVQPQAPAEEGVAVTERRTPEEVEKKLEKKIDDVKSDSRLNRRAIDQLEKDRLQPLGDFMRDAQWAKRISLGGDLRLRYQKDYLDEENATLARPDQPTRLMNTTEDRERFRARVRLDLKAKLIDPRTTNVGKVDAGFRVSTGNDDDPVSTNETLGDYFNKDAVAFDRYYLQWQFKPELPIWNRIPQIALTGGRMPNPWFSSDLVWDDDLNFEGIALSVVTDTLAENGWRLFLTGGAFPLQEVELSSDDKWLYAAQIGIEAEPFYGVGIKVGAAYYDFRNITGKVNDIGSPGQTDYTAPLFLQKGNTLMDIDPAPNGDDGSGVRPALASEFKVLDLTGQLDLSFFHPVHIIFDGTYVKNLGFDEEEVSERVGYQREAKDEGYRFGLRVGYPLIADFGEWNTSFHYRYLEADAMVDAFTDSDFHLGGTNCKGWIAGAEYGLYKNVWIRMRWLTADEIEGPPLAIDGLQLDLNARF